MKQTLLQGLRCLGLETHRPVEETRLPVLMPKRWPVAMSDKWVAFLF